jgi:hypothetical protein
MESIKKGAHIHQSMCTSIISMDPIFDFAINVIQVCASIFTTDLHFNHPYTNSEEKDKSGKDIHMSDNERFKKR